MIPSSEELLARLNSSAPLSEGTDISEHPAPGTPVSGYRLYKVYENDKLGSPNQHFLVDKNEIQVDPQGRGFYYWRNEETARDYMYQTIPWLGGLESKNLRGMAIYPIEGNATDYPFKEYKERDENHVGFTADEVKVSPDPVLFLTVDEIKEVLSQMRKL